MSKATHKKAKIIALNDEERSFWLGSFCKQALSKLTSFLYYSAWKSNFGLIESVIFLGIKQKPSIAVSRVLSVAPTRILVSGCV